MKAYKTLTINESGNIQLEKNNLKFMEYFNLKIESVVFYAEGKRLYGNLHLPTNKNPPCIIALHGLQSSKDSGKWPILASRFCVEGFACLRFSFMGCGKGTEKSDGDFEDTSLTDRIKDYRAAIRFLEEKRKVDMGKLGIIGSSFGGMVAIAAKSKKSKAMVSLSTPHTLSRSRKPQLKIEEGYYILSSGRKLKEKFFADLQKYDILKAIKDAPPILIIHGSKDELVSVEHAYMLYENAKKQKKLEIIEGANHTFSGAKVLDKIIKLSLNWFKKYLT